MTLKKTPTNGGEAAPAIASPEAAPAPALALTQALPGVTHAAQHPAPHPPPTRLSEPDLSYYRVIMDNLVAARERVTVWEQALQAIAPVIQARLGVKGPFTIDAEGFVHEAQEGSRE